MIHVHLLIDSYHGDCCSAVKSKLQCSWRCRLHSNTDQHHHEIKYRCWSEENEKEGDGKEDDGKEDDKEDH